jgi:hypothetical protein
MSMAMSGNGALIIGIIITKELPPMAVLGYLILAPIYAYSGAAPGIIIPKIVAPRLGKVVLKQLV